MQGNFFCDFPGFHDFESLWEPSQEKESIVCVRMERKIHPSGGFEPLRRHCVVSLGKTH